MIEIMCKLYPSGLKDNGIWENAGGNLAVVQLSASGKAQWVEAINLLFKGGGGTTPESLINTVLQDFSNNKDVIALFNIL